MTLHANTARHFGATAPYACNLLPDGAKTMTQPTQLDLFEATDDRLYRAEGLAFALYGMLTEATCINGSTPEAQALYALAEALQDNIKRGRALHAEEWKAAQSAR